MAEAEILQELKQFRQENRQQFDDLRSDLSGLHNRLGEAEDRIGKAEERIQASEEATLEMLKLHVRLDEKLTEMGSHSRRDNLRIYGVAEESERDSVNMLSFVNKLLHEGLQLSEEMPDLQIQRAHRSLGPQPTAGAPPRSIVVRFLSFTVKEMLLHKAWQRKGFKWKDNHVNLDHDYPPSIIAKRKEYAEIRKVLKANNVKFQTLFPARLRVKHEDGPKTYNTPTEAAEDLVNRGYVITTMPAPPPASLTERIKQLSWTRVNRRATKATRDPTRDASYKEKLRTFRRTTPGATAD
ncbi:unnamed protein product [Knipowitschia caucasica]|uniref:L1 transposable element RRM domain-containing protein n=1 Tax=Knipowitschia caucasica TaxID=637954 RepID=A0AAV2J059_KNICA